MDLLPLRVNLAQGLLESQESSLVPDGFLTQCLNWVPEPTGGVRVRGKVKAGSTTGAPTTRRNVGIGMFSRYTEPQLVQIVGPIYTTATGAQTPVFPLSRPASVGNMLIALFGFGRAGTGIAAGSITTVTATGWTLRGSLPSNVGSAAFAYDKTVTSAVSGDYTPFTFTVSGSGTTMVMYMLEVSGITDIDVTATGFASGAAFSTASVSATTATTTQASTFAVALDHVVRYAAAATPAFTLSTASTGWTERGEGGQTNFTNQAWQEVAVYTSAASTAGTQTITVANSVPSVGAITGVDQRLFLLTYKGWNTDPTPDVSIDTYLTAHDTGSTYTIYSIPRTELATGTYTAIDSSLATSGDPVAFTMGLAACWYTAPSFTGIRRYAGGTPAYVTGSPVGARCIAISHSRLWVGGSIQNPSRVYFSQVGDGSTWSTGTTTVRGTGYFDIGTDDGEPVEDITPFGGGLVIGKQTSLHFLAGSNTNEFQVVQLNAGGAAPGRSILATPYGCVIAGREQIWLYDGESVIPIGRGVQSSYGVAEGAFVSLSYQDGSVYIADGTSAYIYVFDLNAGVWHMERTGTLAGDATAVMYNYGDTQLFGPVASTTSSLLGFRTFPDPDRGRDEGLPEIFRAATGDRWFAGPRNPITPRMLWVQTRQRDGDETEAGIDIDVVYDSGEAEETQFITSRTEGVYRDMLVFSDTGRGRGSVKLTFAHIAEDDEDVTYDLEAIAIDVERGDAR